MQHRPVLPVHRILVGVRVLGVDSELGAAVEDDEFLVRLGPGRRPPLDVLRRRRSRRGARVETVDGDAALVHRRQLRYMYFAGGDDSSHYH